MSNSLCLNPCETCEKAGLPLLLARYAVVPTELKAPAPEGKLEDPTLKAIPLGSHAQYTTRLLRSGYVYVYDERYANEWAEYFVTLDGFLVRLPARMTCSPTPPQPPATEFACARTGARPLASVITIRNPKHAKTLWISFSDTQWTDTVMGRHNDKGYRQKHMTPIQVSGGKIAPQPRAVPLEQLRERLPEYGTERLAPATYEQLLKNPSPFAFNKRENEAQALIDACQRIRPQGGAAIVVLNDPVGIAVEIAQLMEKRINDFKNRPEFKRRLFVATKIEEIKHAVLNAGELAEIDEAQKLEDAKADLEREHGVPIKVPEVRPEQMARSADSAWTKYKIKFDEEARTEWKKQFDNALVEYENDHIWPLSHAHVAWMSSNAMVQQFALNHDDKDYHSGIAYAETLALCIAHTQDKFACKDLYDKWLRVDKPTQETLLLNALFLNQALVREKLDESLNQPMDWKGLSWDKLFEDMAKVTDNQIQGTPDTIGRLIGMASGMLVTLLSDAAQNGKVYYSLVALGVVSGQPIIPLELTGKKVQFRRLLVKQLYEATGRQLTRKQLDKIVQAELRRLQVLGVDLQGNETRRFLLLLDPEELRAMPRGLTPLQQAKWIAARYQKPEDVQALNLSRWRSRVAATGRQVAAATRVPIGKIKPWSASGFAVLGLAANLAALSSITTDDAKVLKHARPEALQRYYAQWAQVIGASVQTLEAFLQRLAVGSARLTRGLASVVARLVSFGGTVLGVGGSLVMSVIDGIRARQEFKQGNYASMYSYGVSAGLGFLATACLFAGWTGIGLLLVVALFLWAFIKPEDDNKIQDWLERVYEWGKLKEQRYRTMEIEMQELEIALKN